MWCLMCVSGTPSVVLIVPWWLVSARCMWCMVQVVPMLPRAGPGAGCMWCMVQVVHMLPRGWSRCRVLVVHGAGGACVTAGLVPVQSACGPGCSWCLCYPGAGPSAGCVWCMVQGADGAHVTLGLVPVQGACGAGCVRCLTRVRIANCYH